MYGRLDSPLPGLTVSPDGCHACGMRGLGSLGDDPLTFDTTPTPTTDTLTFNSDPNALLDTSQVGILPLDNAISPSIEAMYPASVGTEFTSNGDGTYTNIQTGQSVPYSVAQQITAATTGSATANLQPTQTTGNLTLTDPNTGASTTVSTNNLTAAAQALNAAGQLITGAGKLTAQGQSLLKSGNLYSAPPATGSSAAMASLTSWMTGSTMIPGVPNIAVALGIVAAGALLVSMVGGKKKR